MIAIRYARPDDFDDVYQLICDLESERLDFNSLHQTYLHNLNDPLIRYLVAFANQRVIGFLSLHIQHILHHEKPTCELQELNIAEPYRSQGIGTKLLEQAEQIASDLGFEEIELTTRIHRVKAQEFYNRHSYNKTHFKYVKKFKV